MTNPQTMTGAELDTLRRACGWEREDLADLCQVQTRTIKHWQSGRAAVPDQVARFVRAQALWLQELTARTLREYAQVLEQARADKLGAPLEVVLVRYKDHAHIVGGNGLETLTPPLHAALTLRVMLALQAQGLEVRLVWFDPVAFDEWAKRQGVGDSQANRAAWAAGEGLDAQICAYGSGAH